MTRKCGKVRYPDRLEALLALSRIAVGDKPGHFEKRAYRCPSCGGWHLASKMRGRRKAA